jgi:hypothetical protein
MVAVLIRIVTDDATPVPIDGVTVRVLNGLGGFVTEGVTDTIGEVTFLLDGSAGGTAYVLLISKTGISVLPDPAVDITVHDPAVPPNEFEFEAHEGATAVLATVVTSDDQVVPVPVQDVSVRVYDEDDVFMTEGVTDANGQFVLPLAGSASPGTSYIIRLRKNGYTVPSGHTQFINVLDPLPVGATNTFDFTLHEVTIPESVDPLMCRVSGYLVDASMQPRKNVNIRFITRKGFPDSSIGIMAQTSNPTVVGGRIIAADVTVTTDRLGYVEVSLPRGGVFDVHVSGLEHPSGVVSPVVIPELSAARLEDILFPYVQSVSYTPNPVSVVLGMFTDVALSITLSSGAALTEVADINNFVVFAVADPSVASAVVINPGQLRVNGASAGSTTISATRATGALIPRSPEIPDLVTTPLTVGVA